MTSMTSNGLPASWCDRIGSPARHAIRARESSIFVLLGLVVPRIIPAGWAVQTRARLSEPTPDSGSSASFPVMRLSSSCALFDQRRRHVGHPTRIFLRVTSCPCFARRVKFDFEKS